MKRISPQIASQYPRTQLEGEEVLITLVGAIGRTAVVPTNLAGANVARAVGVIPLTRRVNPHWIEFWFRNPLNQALMVSKAHEVARKTLNLEDVRAAMVAIPPAGEQRRIVDEVSRRMSFIEEIEATVEAHIKRAGLLRQSILSFAFQGRLVSQDHDTEPASALLERIRQSRQQQSQDRPTRRRSAWPAPEGRPNVALGINIEEAPPTLLAEPRKGNISDSPGEDAAGLKKERAQKESPGSFTDLPVEEQIDAVWESLFGRGALEKDNAVRAAAEALRDRGLARFQRLHQGGALYQAVNSAIGQGLRAGDFDRPKRGHIRAVLRDPRDYPPETWCFCLQESFDHQVVEEDEALRAAAEWARENLGLEYGRLRKDGIILRGLRAALDEALRRGEVVRTGKDRIERTVRT